MFENPRDTNPKGDHAMKFTKARMGTTQSANKSRQDIGSREQQERERARSVGAGAQTVRESGRAYRTERQEQGRG